MKVINKTHFKFLSLGILALTFSISSMATAQDHGTFKTRVASFSPDGTKVITALDDTAKILDLKTGEIKTVQHDKWVKAAAFSPNSSKVVTVSIFGVVKVLNLVTGEETMIPNGEGTDQPDLIQYSPAAISFKHQFSNSDDIAVIHSVNNYWSRPSRDQIINLKTGEFTTHKFRDSYDGDVRKIHHHSPGRSRVLTFLEKGLEVWFCRGGPIFEGDGEKIIIPHDQEVATAKVSPDGLWVVTASYDGTAKVLNLETKEIITVQHEGGVHRAEISPDSSKVLTLSSDGTSKLLDLNSREIKTFNAGEGYWLGGSFSPDGSKIILTNKNILKSIDLVTGEEYQIENDRSVYEFSFSPDGKKVVTATEGSKNAKVLDLQTGETWTISHSDTIRHMAFSPDSSKLISATESLSDDYLEKIYSAKILDFETRELKTLEEFGFERREIAKLLFNEDPFVRRQQALKLGGNVALGERPDSKFTPILITALNDEDAGVRANAAMSLGKIGDSKAVLELIKLVDKKSEKLLVRRNAILALGLIGDTTAVPSLLELVQDENAMLRNAAKAALKKIKLVEKINETEAPDLHLQNGVESNHHSAALTPANPIARES